ncbi:pseudouridine synthase [Chitinophaga sp. XS-30]|uniref:pseudouridine synthase n=1 Tax=Chitinophaga sp. XS-30 TaxID=2604421 RepID=UPI0011DD44C8|nr:pseudouridine synthase [Chitinophaga sp. XS-30]QEH40690.1 pseudouridine synthase [Chitinophaga sp. XS-30]
MKKSRPAKKGFTPFKENRSKPGAASSKRSGDERAAKGEERRGKRFGSDDDRPKRSFGSNEDKPKRSFGNSEDRPKRSFSKDEDRPKRSFGNSEDRPKRSFSKDEDRPKRSFGNSEDKPKRSFSKDEDRPKRSFGGSEDRPKRNFSKDEDRPKRSFGNSEDKPKRSFSKDEDRPKRSFGSSEDRPKRSFSKDEDRPKRSFGDGETSPKKRSGNDSDRPKKSERKAAVHGAKAPKGKSTRKRIAVDSPATDAAENEMPLNKFIAHCGICSRRKAVDYIKEGKVLVNDEKIIEPAFKVTAKDVVKLNDKRIYIQKNLVYVLLNKPKGYITTTDDPEGRRTVMELVEEAAEERLFPVGRLDRNTSGLLLLTNDGELAQKLAHPKHNIKKIYHVELDKPLTKADFETIIAGVTLEDGVALVDALGYVDNKDKKQIGIEIHSGKNRIVRRIFEHLQYQVEKLDRVMYAGLTKKNVNRGKWRFLTDKEVILLKHFK